MSRTTLVIRATGFEQMPTKATSLHPASVPPVTPRSPVSPGQMTSADPIYTKPRTFRQCIAVVTPATRENEPQAPLRLAPQPSWTLTREKGTLQPQRANSLPSFVQNRLVIPWKCIETNLLRKVMLNKADPARSYHQEPQNPATPRKTWNVLRETPQASTRRIRQTE